MTSRPQLGGANEVTNIGQEQAQHLKLLLWPTSKYGLTSQVNILNISWSLLLKTLGLSVQWETVRCYAQSVTSKKSPNVYKSYPKMISLEFFLKLQIFLWMWKICVKSLLQKALKSCPKSNKSPNLVTLHAQQERKKVENKSSAWTPGCGAGWSEMECRAGGDSWIHLGLA